MSDTMEYTSSVYQIIFSSDLIRCHRFGVMKIGFQCGTYLWARLCMHHGLSFILNNPFMNGTDRSQVQGSYLISIHCASRIWCMMMRSTDLVSLLL
jgi:hypothetical protein